MHGSHFDSLTTQLTPRLSRRSGVRGLAVVVFLGALGLRTPEESTAKKKGKRCPPCKKCKNGKCKKTRPDGTACTITGGGAGMCQSGKCLATLVCSEGTTHCAGACVDIRADPVNCGACGTRCRVNETCIDGACACTSSNAGTCPTGFTCCPLQFGGGCACGSSPTFVDPATCDEPETCPTNTIACIGTSGCRTCCPAGTTCDTDTGACLQ
jgi:hypothetical protein